MIIGWLIFSTLLNIGLVILWANTSIKYDFFRRLARDMREILQREGCTWYDDYDI